jgi:hypothetical protein
MTFYCLICDEDGAPYSDSLCPSCRESYVSIRPVLQRFVDSRSMPLEHLRDLLDTVVDDMQKEKDL